MSPVMELPGMTLTGKKLPENKQSEDLPPNQRQDICAGVQARWSVRCLERRSQRSCWRSRSNKKSEEDAVSQQWAGTSVSKVRGSAAPLPSNRLSFSGICGLSSLSTLTVSSGIFPFTISFNFYLSVDSFICFLVICQLLYLKICA